MLKQTTTKVSIQSGKLENTWKMGLHFSVMEIHKNSQNHEKIKEFHFL